MNSYALETLEFNKIKANLKTFAVSEYGQNRIDTLVPGNHFEKIQNQMQETTEAKNILEKTTSIPLGSLIGIEFIISKLEKGIVLAEDELAACSKFLKSTKKMKTFMQEKSNLAPTISQIAYSMFDLTDISSEIDRCIVNNRIDDHATQTLEKTRKKIYVTEGRMKTKLGSIIQSSALKPFLQDSNIGIKNSHYVVSVKSEYRKEIPGLVIEKSSTGATLFIEPESVGRYHGELSLLKMDESNEEYQIRLHLTNMLGAYLKEININIDALTYYDFVFAKGKYSKSINGFPAVVNLSGFTKIVNGRHPLLGTPCIPLNFEIGSDYRCLVITGPNTGGKTVALKTVGLLTMMTQAGLHIPAEAGSQIAVFSDILVDIGDGQSIEQSLSTFSSHIKNIIEIIRCSSKYTLVILDEIGAGTDPIEGEGLAIAILEELFQKGSTILATSHYSKVKSYANNNHGFINGNMTFDLVSLKPLYQLQIGKAGDSNALIIAMKLGMNQKLIENAHFITYHEEKDYTDLYTREVNNQIPQSTNYEKQSKMRTNANDLTSVFSKEQKFKIGDLVYVHSLKQKGVIFSEENNKEEYGVMINDKKVFIHKKRLALFIDAKELYPEDYDMDIVLKTKEYRKKNKLMNKHYDKDLTLTYTEKDLL